METAYKLLAYAYGEEGMKLLMWGIDGEDYTVDADGYPTFTYDFQGDNSVLQPRGLKYWGWLVHNHQYCGSQFGISDRTGQKKSYGTCEQKSRNRHDPLRNRFRRSKY